MTAKEAIVILEFWLRGVEEDSINIMFDLSDYVKALKLAIEALNQFAEDSKKVSAEGQDSISRQMAISHVDDVPYINEHPNVGLLWKAWIESLPAAQPEVRPIDYQDCSNAMLKMWMDNVVTDGEYNRIMDKLNAHWGKRDE